MDIALAFVFPFVPILVVWIILRYGPIRTRWQRAEHPLGVAVTIGTVGFLLGFFGPMVLVPEANQGPLLGIFYTGPFGFVAGLVWGLARAWRLTGN